MYSVTKNRLKRLGFFSSSIGSHSWLNSLRRRVTSDYAGQTQ